MKPFQAILLAVFGISALLGLALFATYKGFGGASTNVGTVLVWGTLPQVAVQAEMDALRNKDQSYAALTYVQKPETGFDTALADALASGTGPDLVLASHEYLHSIQNKINIIPFSSISERTYLDTYLPETELYLTTTGTYGIPLYIDPLILFYNRPLLASSGVATPPRTWDSATGLASTLTHVATGQITQSVVPFGSYDNVENARAIVSLLMLQSGSSITGLNNGTTRSTLGIAQGSAPQGTTEASLNFFTQFADPAKLTYTWNSSLPSARQAFTSGSLVLYPGFASEIPTIAATNPNLDFDISYIPQPASAATRVTYGRVYALSITKSAKNPTGAYLAAVALADPTVSAFSTQKLSMAGATRASQSDAGLNKYTAVFVPEALIARGWISPAPAVTDQIFGTMIRSIASGRAAVSEALQTASQALDASL